MHPFRSVLIGLALSYPTLAVAQQASRLLVGPAVHAMRDSVGIVRLGEMALRNPSAVTSTRGHHARVGAATGAALGAAAGIIGSAFLHVGCTRDPCHDGRARLGLALWFGSLGAVGGGILGSAVGAVIPASSSRP